MSILRLIVAVFLGLAASVHGADADVRSGLTEYTVSIGTTDRQYFLFVPAGLPGNSPRPLIIGFHGGGGTALGFGKRTGLRQLAVKHGAVIALPQGFRASGARGGTWNVESATPVGYADRNDVQDLKFLDAMIAEISSALPIARDKVFATGLSQGGMMALRLACERPGLLAGVAPVAGTLASGRCAHPGKVDVLHIHGSSDQNVPFAGGRGKFSNRAANWTSVTASMDAMFQSARCDINRSKVAVTRDTNCTLSGCSGGQRRQLCVVDDGGHGWPGIAPVKWQIKRDQYISPYFDATDYIGRFFFDR